MSRYEAAVKLNAMRVGYIKDLGRELYEWLKKFEKEGFVKIHNLTYQVVKKIRVQ